jgi:hypothetical protein
MALVAHQRHAVAAEFDPLTRYRSADGGGAAPHPASDANGKAARARAHAAAAAANAFALRPLTVAVRKRPLNRDERVGGQFDVLSCPDAR